MRVIPWLGIILTMLYGINRGWTSEKEKDELLDPPKINCSSFTSPPSSFPLPSKTKICRNTPYEIDFHTFRFLPTPALLQMRCVNKYWKIVAEDVIKRDKRKIVVAIDRIEWDAPKLKFTLPIYDLKLTHFYRRYQEKFAAFMQAFIHKNDVIKLSFSENRFGALRLQYILPFVRQFNNIVILDLSCNNILSSMLPLFPSYLKGMPHLKLINLEQNLIRSFANPCWVHYLREEEQLAMVLCSQQQKIKEKAGRRKKIRSREDLRNVILPEDEGTLVKMILTKEK